jgi:hypothetical protein
MASRFRSSTWPSTAMIGGGGSSAAKPDGKSGSLQATMRPPSAAQAFDLVCDLGFAWGSAAFRRRPAARAGTRLGALRGHRHSEPSVPQT